MTRAEADKIIERVKNGCIYHRFTSLSPRGICAGDIRTVYYESTNALIEEDSQSKAHGAHKSAQKA